MVERSYAADFMSTFVSMFTAFSNFSAFFSARLPTSSSFVRPAHNTEKGTPRSSTAPHQMRSDIVRCYLRAILALIPIFHQPKVRGIYKALPSQSAKPLQFCLSYHSRIHQKHQVNLAN